MAINIVSPDYSFVQMLAPNSFNNSACLPQSLCLPVLNISDIAFQMVVEATGADQAWFNQTYTGTEVYPGDTPVSGNSILHSTISARICTDCSDPGNALLFDYQYPATYIQLSTGDGETSYAGYFQNNSLLTDWNSIATGTCFNICFYKLSYIATPGSPILNKLVEVVNLGCSYTCFYKSDDDCFTSVLQYSNNSDAFEFLYDILSSLSGPPIDYMNTVRLPFYLHSPAYTEEQTTYQRSDGSSVKLAHRIWKDYKFKTDYWYDEWVQKFVVATAHDNVLIACPYLNLVAGAFVRTAKVETEWYQEDTPSVLRGVSKGTLRLVPGVGVNSNC